MLITLRRLRIIFFFFFNDTATTEIYTLSLHDALPISFSEPKLIKLASGYEAVTHSRAHNLPTFAATVPFDHIKRSEEHTSELQSRLHLVCRLLLEKKKQYTCSISTPHSLTTSNTAAAS